MKIISVKKSPEYKDRAIKYFQSKWASPSSMKVYEDCITNCITSTSPLPQWYLLLDNDKIIGCAGLITKILSVVWIYILGYVQFTLRKTTGAIIMVLY